MKIISIYISLQKLQCCYFEANSNFIYIHIYKQGVRKEVAYIFSKLQRKCYSFFFFFFFNLHVESSVVPLVRLHLVQSVRREHVIKKFDPRYRATPTALIYR